MNGNFFALVLVAAADQREVYTRMFRENRCDGIDQLLPPFPRANADLGDEKTIVVDPFLMAECSRIPSLRIEERDIGSGVDDFDFFGRQTAAGNDHFLDLLADGYDRSTRWVRY